MINIISQTFLSFQDYQLLLLLQNDPTLSYKKIAKELGVSAPTAKNWVKKLREIGVYRGKTVLYKPESLGLTRFLFLIFSRGVGELEQLELALKYHPYIVSRSRLYGSRLGLISQFNYPSEDPTMLIDFFERLKELGLVQSFLYYKSLGVRKSMSIDLKRLSLSTFKWHYDWSHCLELLSDIKVESFPQSSKSVFDQMKPVDFKILEILTKGKIPLAAGGYDTELTQAKISSYLNIQSTEMWRRYHFLEENVLSGYTSRFSREFFNISSDKIIFMSFANDEELLKCYYLFSDEKEGPPFRYHIELFYDKQKRKHLVLYVSLPQYHEAQLIYCLSKVSSIRVFNVDSIGRNSVSYAFYPEAVDTEAKCWKLDKEFVLDTPLNEITEILTNTNKPDFRQQITEV